MKCPQCGVELKAGLKFCTKCGGKMIAPGPMPVRSARPPESRLETVAQTTRYGGVAAKQNKEAASPLNTEKKKSSILNSNFKWIVPPLIWACLIVSAYLFGGDTEGLGWWIATYMFEVGVWFWVVYLGGADWLEGSFLSAIFVSILAPRWNSDGIKLFIWAVFVFQTIYFIIGLFSPSMRM